MQVNRPVKVSSKKPAVVIEEDDEDDGDDDDHAMPPPKSTRTVKAAKAPAATKTAKSTRPKVVKAAAKPKANKPELSTIAEDAPEPKAKAKKVAAAAKKPKGKVNFVATQINLDETPNGRKADASTAVKRKVNMDASMGVGPTNETEAEAEAEAEVEPKPEVEDMDITSEYEESGSDSGVQVDEPAMEPTTLPPPPLKSHEPLHAIENKNNISSDSVMILGESIPTIDLSETNGSRARYSFDALLTEDETEDEDDPETLENRMPPPEWSLRENRMQYIIEQSQIGYNWRDKLFSINQDVDLLAIFPQIDKRDLKRRSSANWATMRDQ